MAEFYAGVLLCVLTALILLVFFKVKAKPKTISSSSALVTVVEFSKNGDRLPQWTTELVKSTPSLTFTLHLPMGMADVVTANPANVQHMLKTNFDSYGKGEIMRSGFYDLLGDGIFNVDGDIWKFQRQLASHEFNIKSLRWFLESVVNVEISYRLLPILRTAAVEETVLDFQDVMQRFGFDNICQMSFGYDPEYLSPSLPEQKFAAAFYTVVRIIDDRFKYMLPILWKIKRFLDLGSEKELRIALCEVKDMAKKIVRQKKHEVEEKAATNEDLLSRFLSAGVSDEKLLMDIVISFILAGQDTTSAALTWFFWLVSKNPHVEDKILREIKQNVSETTSAGYKDVKQLVYTHAAICESMRLYPPVPVDSREAFQDDVLPDGTFVKKGWFLSYNTFAMGRIEAVWGDDWSKFKPERWLEETVDGKVSFVNRDPYTYPVFNAGPRVCLGKEMAFLQMKSVISAVLQEFRVVPVADDGAEPIYLTLVTAKMKGGFPVRIAARAAQGQGTEHKS